MKRVLKFIAITALLICSVLGVGVLALFYCLGESLCGNRIVSEVIAPNKRLKATVFRRDCGATDGFSTQVSVISAFDQLPNKSGNAFSADTNHGAAPQAEADGPIVQVEWQSDNALVIRHHPAARVFTQRKEVDEVQLSYDRYKQ
ncbi:MAG: hypothetical protein Q7T97_18360 [Burkholderiaceae bacterium]|nr:hypothetical protein [Burkholderiaceae bacterium]